MTERIASESGPIGPDDVMVVNAAREIGRLVAAGQRVCFVGIGLPSTAANLARRLYDPGPILVYESGCLGSKPSHLPLSIGDGELGDTADAVISIPEIFAYWLQPGRIDVGFLGGAQLDRYANINSTVIGRYEEPTVRLPGAGGAPEIAASSQQVIVMIRQTRRTFVERCDFRTSVGFGDGAGYRERLGLRGRGPVKVITDLGILEPDPETCELVQVAVHPGSSAGRSRESTAWPLQVAADLATTEAPSGVELDALRELRRS